MYNSQNLEMFASNYVDTSAFSYDGRYDPTSLLSDARKRLESIHSEYVQSATPEGPSDDWAVLHKDLFASVWNWHLRYYYTYSDESQQQGMANSLAMRRDGFVQELLWHRQLPVVNLPFVIECEDPDDEGQAAVRKEVTSIFGKIPYMQRFKLQLLEAGFFGKSAAQIRWGKRRIAGKEYSTVVDHLPVNGDKLAFRWDMTPGVFIYGNSDLARLHPDVQKHIVALDRGKCLFLDEESYRDRFVVHMFQPTDFDFLFEADKAAGVRGVGFRDRFYWTWNMRAQVLDWILAAIERVGANGMLYAYYPAGNAQARSAVIRALKDFMSTNVGAFPRAMGDTSSLIDKIDASPVGYDVMFQLLAHLEGIMRRGWLGQNLSSQSAATGLGSGVADLQGESKDDVVVFDASCLAETISEQVLKPILKYNIWEYNGKSYRGDELPFSLTYKIQAEKKDVLALMQAAKALWEMGVPLDSEDLRGKTEFKPPRSKATTIVNMGGMQGTTPNADAVEAETGKPAPGKEESPEKFHKIGPIDRASARVHPNPTPGQKKAGNYRKAHVRVQGLPITIETRRGRIRSGVDKTGSEWRVKMAHHYGYIKKTRSAADADHIDVFIGRHPRSEAVFIINQIDPDTGLFDEHKCMIGFMSKEDASKGYLSCYGDGWSGLGSIHHVSMDEFKRWIVNGDTAHPYRSYSPLERFGADDPEFFGEDPCGDGGGTHGFHKGNTCQAGGKGSAASPKRRGAARDASLRPSGSVRRGARPIDRGLTVHEEKEVEHTLDQIFPKKTSSEVDELVAKIAAAPMLSTKAAAAIIGGDKPEHLDDVEKFLEGQRDKLLSGRLRPRDVAKALMLTIASQGSGARSVDVVRNALGAESPFIRWLDGSEEGQWFQAVSTTPGKDKAKTPQIRPEDVAGGWFLTPAGRKALDELDSGNFDPSHWSEFVALRKAFGDDRISTANVLGDAATSKKVGLKEVHEITKEINDAKGNPEKVGKILSRFKGIGAGKIGFIKHFIGMGDTTTVDAVQVNFWLTGKGDVSTLEGDAAELARAFKGHAGNSRVSRAMAERVNKQMKLLSRYIKMKYGKEVSQHILHHWLWDAAKGSVARHIGMYTGYTLGQRDEFEVEQFMRADASDPGVCVMLPVPDATAAMIALPEGPDRIAKEDLHVTIAYIGRRSTLTDEQMDAVRVACRLIAEGTPPLLGSIGGFGRFSATESSDGKDVVYAGVDLPDLESLRDDMIKILTYSKIPFSRTHGYTPHATLAYVGTSEDSPVSRIGNIPARVDRLCLAVGDEKEYYRFES